jgi:CPA1 family monovalent cation:H+ antiporter
MLGIFLAALLEKPLGRVVWIPLPVALVFLGFIASEIWVGMGMDTGLRWQILRDLVFYLLLPVLIFETAINVDTRWLKRESVLIGALSIPLLFVGAGVAAWIILGLMGSTLDDNWALAVLMGVMVCATDPAMISGVLGESRGVGRVMHILEGESLINDATTIALFMMLTSYLVLPGIETTVSGLIVHFALVLLGGAATGVILGWTFDFVIAPANDKVLSTSVTLVLAFTSFWVSEHLLGFSGVVATLSAGLTIAWRQRTHRSESDIAFAMDSWRLLGFCANAMLFFLVGMSITVQMFQEHWLIMIVAIVAALASRAVIVLGALGPISLLPGIQNLRFADQNLIMWGGVRGAVAIALALSLSTDLEHWYEIQSAVYGVALFSLIVQTPIVQYLAQLRITRAVKNEG